MFTRHAFNISDTYDFKARGLVVITDRALADLPSWLAMKVGDDIEFRSEVGTVQARVKGIEFISPWTPGNSFAFLISAGFPQEQISPGCQIWVTESSVVKNREEP